jgi:hypothetical protein
MFLVLLDLVGAGRGRAVVSGGGRRGSGRRLGGHGGANNECEASEGRNDGFHDVVYPLFSEAVKSVFHYERRSSPLTGDEAAIKVSTDYSVSRVPDSCAASASSAALGPAALASASTRAASSICERGTCT